MNKPRIILPDGTPVEELKVTIFGYQMEHVQTGRLLPTTTRDQIYSITAAVKKMNEVAGMYELMQEPINIFEYRAVPVYDFELPNVYTYIISDDD